MGGKDTITAAGGDSFLFGGTGNDWMLAGSFNDILNGGAGNDIMDGGLGYDWADYQDATGGVKVDLALTAAGSTATGTDRILDFTASQADKIDVHGLALLAANFIGSAGFSGIAGQMHTVDLGGTYRVGVDSNGDGRADGLVIDVTSATALTAADLLF